MLQQQAHEEPCSTLGVTSSSRPTQVTPQELAQAIVTVEARQCSAAPVQISTTTLEDTIRQLELTVTPEELLAELHTQRTTAHQQAVMTPPRNKRSVSWWLLLTGCVLSTTLTIVVCFWAFQMAVYNQKLSNAYSELQTSYSTLQTLNSTLHNANKALDRALKSRVSPPSKRQGNLHK